MEGIRQDLPIGTVTFLFSDIEGSTRLVSKLGPEDFRGILERHQEILRDSFRANGGVDRGTQGDSFLVVFSDAASAVSAAVDAQRALARADWPPGADVRVRMGLHTGVAFAGGDDYVGIDINRAARIAGVAHGGQVVLSDATRALTERSLPSGVELRDLGEHALKDLTLRERLFQLVIDGLPSDFPALRSARPALGDLPTRLTSFVGRDAELTELASLMRRERLVTLTGPGGTGKTSLAVELARLLAPDFEDGAWFVPLDAIADPSLVSASIVTALGLRDVTGRPARDRLLDNLVARNPLFILDNFEHLLDAAGLVVELLSAAPRTAFLVTSRAPLRVSAEQTYPVASLPTPQAGLSLVAEGAVASVELFVERARHVQPAFALDDDAEAVGEICRLLDGLPLGIELAAAKISLLGASGIRDLLAQHLKLPGPTMRDTPTRQRTLHDTVAWSHDLLDGPSRALFARMAIFRGGCRADELQAVCSVTEESEADVLDTVALLVDQSLVMAVDRGRGVRYEMLETIRTYATERLGASGERPEVGRRHALAYLALAEIGAPLLRRRGQKPVLDRLTADRENIRAALRWAIDHDDANVAMRLGTALMWYWCLGGELAEGRTSLMDALAMPGAQTRTATRMRALEAAGTVFYYSGEMERASELYQGQLDLARELRDPLGTADALFNLPFASPLEDWSDLEAQNDEAAAIYASLGEQRKLARTMSARAAGLSLAGRTDEAAILMQEAYERARKLDDAYLEAFTAGGLGLSSLEAGDREGMARWFLVALSVARELSDVAGMTLSLPWAAAATYELVGPEPAATIMGAYETFSRLYGIRPSIGLQKVMQRFDPLARSRAELDPDVFELSIERGRAMTPDAAVAFVFSQVDEARATITGDPVGRPPAPS